MGRHLFPAQTPTPGPVPLLRRHRHRDRLRHPGLGLARLAVNLQRQLWADVDGGRQFGEVLCDRVRLGLHGESFAALSAYLWGRTLSAERDRRAGAGANKQDRGRITRRLKAEMKAVLDGKD
jgi:hypothetical protein